MPLWSLDPNRVQKNRSYLYPQFICHFSFSHVSPEMYISYITCVYVWMQFLCLLITTDLYAHGSGVQYSSGASSNTEFFFSSSSSS